jgi:hypothetical protein
VYGANGIINGAIEGRENKIAERLKALGYIE